MKPLFLLTILFVAAVSTMPAGSESGSSAEVRIAALEAKVASLEQRLVQLEQAVEEPSADEVSADTAEADDANDGSDCDNMAKLAQKLNESIELNKHQLKSLSGIDVKSEENKREVASKKYKLYNDLERDYSKMVRLAGKCPSLGFDVIKLKKTLIDCQAEKRELEMKRAEKEKPDPKKQTQSQQIPKSRPFKTSSPPRKQTGTKVIGN